MPLKHDRTAESHTGVYGGKKKNFFSSFTYTGWGGYIMPEKHDQTAESRAGVLGQKKKNFFSSFTYTGWGELLNVQEIQFFFLLHTQDGGVTLCMRNTIEQLNHTLGFLDRRRRIFFLLLHLQDGGNSIVLEKHNRTAGSHTGALRQKKKNFFSSSTFTRWS